MKPLLKFGLGSSLIAGLGGGAYGVYSISSFKTYEEIFQGTLLSENSKHSESGNSRFQALNKVKNNEIDELKNLSSLDDLKQGCKQAVKKKSGGEDDPIFKAIQNYCTQTIKDAITPLVEKSGTDNTKAGKRRQDKLATIADGNLVQTLLDIKKGTDKTGAKVKEGCLLTYTNTFKGIKDKEFSNAQEICDRKEITSNLIDDINKQIIGDGEGKAKLTEYERQDKDPFKIKSLSNKEKALTDTCKSKLNKVLDKEEQEFKDFETGCTKPKVGG